MPEIVQEIGAYAGLASVVGLALLSVLYFSQARDVKRLREWAGRAPERAEQGTAVTEPTPGRVVAQPQAQPQAQQRPPAAKAPAVPAATGARPAAAPAAAAAAQDKQAQPAAAPAAAGAAAAAATKPTAATAQSGQQNAPGAPQQQPASATTALKEGAPPPAQPQPAPGSGQPAAAPAGAQGAPSGAPAKAGAPPVPGAPRPAAGAAAGGRQDGPPLPPAPAKPLPAGRPTPQQTQVIPPKRESWHQRIFGSTRNLILAIGGVLLLGAGVALALTQLSGDESEPPPAAQGQQQQPQAEENDDGEDNGEAQRPNRPAIEPSSVTVAVLNGTTVPGLAARVSDEVQSAGFEVGTVANSSDQQRAESVILFSPGHEREAAAVSRRLDIAQREPIDAATQGLAGDATVVVVTGADRS